MEFIGLKKFGQGTNYVFDDCCPQTVTIKFKVGINDAPIMLHGMYVVSGTCSFSILEINGASYVNPLSPYIYMPADSEIDIKLEYCSCLGVGNSEVRSIQVEWQDLITHTTYSQPFAFLFESLDITTAVFNTDTDVTFYDCSNDCGRVQDLTTFTNPSAFDVTLNFVNSSSCSFDFLTNGISLIQTLPNNYTLSIPGNGSVVIQIANPACYITSPCPLTLTWDICGGSSNWINVTHDIIFCDVCGIDCNGISITTGPFPSGTTTDQWRSLNPGPSWTSIPYSGCPFDMVQQTSNNSYIELESGSGCVSGQIVYILPNVQIDYSGLANNGDIVDIEYAFYSGHNWTIPPSYLALHIPFISGGATYVISGAVHPGTWYMGTITGVTFTYPGAAGTAQDGGSYSINITSATTPGEHAQIYYAGIRIRKQSQTYLIDPTDLNCSDMSLYNQTAIGDKKTITYHLNYINGFQDNTRLWFNPWIYSQTGDFAGQYFNGTINQEPASGWFITTHASWVGDSQLHDMSLVAGGNEGSQKNGIARLEIISSTEFKIHYDFYIIEDQLQWIGTNQLNNNRKLLYSSKTETNPLSIQTPSSYTENRQLASLFYIYDPNVIVNTIGGRPVYYECASTKRVFFTNRFWNKGIGGNFSEMSNPRFEFTRGAAPVTDLSLFTDTEVSFKIDYGSSVDSVVFWLFDVSATDNTIDFYDNYDSSRALIQNVPAVGSIIDNHIIGPATACALIGGSTYQTTASIGNGLRSGSIYRLGAICYDNTNKIVNSFLSDELRVNNLPDKSWMCTNLDVTSTWQNYFNSYTSTCFSPTIKERVQNQILFQPGGLTTKLQALGMPVGGSWLDYLVGINLNIYQKQEDYPVVDTMTLFTYKQYQINRNTSLPGNWENPFPDEFGVLESGTDITTNWFGRPLWDGSAFNPMNVAVAPMNQYLTKTSAGPAASTYIAAYNITNDWSDRDIFFEYNLIFDLTPLIGFLFELVLTQVNVMHPIAEETTPLPFTQVLTDVKIFGVKIGHPEVELHDQTCDTSFDYLIIRVYGAGAALDNFIAIFEPYPYSNSSIYEENPAAGNFTQLDTIYIDNCSVGFDNTGMAEYRVYLSSLGPGTYKFSGLRIVA